MKHSKMLPLYININVISGFIQIFVQKFQIALESYWYTLIKSKLLQSEDSKVCGKVFGVRLARGTSGAGKDMPSWSCQGHSLAAPSSFWSEKSIMLVREYVKKAEKQFQFCHLRASFILCSVQFLQLTSQNDKKHCLEDLTRNVCFSKCAVSATDK